MLNNKKVFAIIMAGGKGTRIGATDKPKAMFEVAGKPIIEWAIRPLEKLKQDGVVDRIIVVVGFFGEYIVDYLGERAEFVWQKEQLGTGHAAKQAENLISTEDGLTIITNGDHPLYRSSTYLNGLEEAAKSGATLTLGIVKDPVRFNDYGRVIRGQDGKVSRVVELKNATEEQKRIEERNPNLYVADNKWLFEALKKVKMNHLKKEYYLTDIIEIAVEEGREVATVEIGDMNEALGINTPEDLKEAETLLTGRK